MLKNAIQLGSMISSAQPGLISRQKSTTAMTTKIPSESCILHKKEFLGNAIRIREIPIQRNGVKTVIL